MFTYADPRVCPSCREPLPQPVSAEHRCTTCDVPVGHPAAADVFAALQRTDTLVASLRAVAGAALAPAPAPAPAPVLTPAPAPVPPAPAGPVVPPLVIPPRTGVRTSSVPAILLGLGALCLLVAAVIFLAVAWGWLGVGGRTAVLAGLTLATGAGGLALRGRGLRIAAEALASVSLGMLVLDVLGAERSGWIGGSDGLTDAGAALVVGLVLTVGGTVLAAGRQDRLVVPQLVAVGGLFVAQAVLPAQTGHELVVAALATAGFVVLAALGRRSGDLAAATWAALAAAALTWCDLTLTALASLDGLDSLTVGDLWTSSTGPALLAAAALLLAPLVIHRDEVLLQACATAAATMTTGVLVLPVLDESATAIASTSLVACTLWTLAAYAVPRARLAVPVVPAAFSLVPATLVAVGLTAQALEAALTPDTSLRLTPGDAFAAPALVVPTVAVLAALLLVLAPSTLRRSALLRIVPAALLLAAVATLALQPVPLWTVVASLAAIAAAYAVDGVRREELGGLTQLVAASALLLGALVLAAPSTPLLLVPLSTLVAVAAVALGAGRFPGAAEVGGLLMPLSLAGLTWVLGDLADLDAYRAVPVLVVLAAAALARPRVEVETVAALAGLVAASAAIPLATDQTVSLALHLTLAGALLVVHSLVHPSRRPVAFAGTALLVLATWVRLADLGVHAPEPYTMPTALLLIAFGLHRMRRDDTSSTALALLPGLLLATVPSFLHVLATDPVSVRAALLGVACLALAVGGAQLRWSAPLLVGAAVGALLVLVELAPYAGQTPQWVVIALAGTVLVVVGTTWERRVVELQRAAHYVGRLR